MGPVAAVGAWATTGADVAAATGASMGVDDLTAAGATSAISAGGRGAPGTGALLWGAGGRVVAGAGACCAEAPLSEKGATHNAAASLCSGDSCASTGVSDLASRSGTTDCWAFGVAHDAWPESAPPIPGAGLPAFTGRPSCGCSIRALATNVPSRGVALVVAPVTGTTSAEPDALTDLLRGRPAFPVLTTPLLPACLQGCRFKAGVGKLCGLDCCSWVYVDMRDAAVRM
jgi:hypothetical protein